MGLLDRLIGKKEEKSEWPPKHAGKSSVTGKYDTGGLKAESGSNNNNQPMGNYSSDNGVTGNGGATS